MAFNPYADEPLLPTVTQAEADAADGDVANYAGVVQRDLDKLRQTHADDLQVASRVRVALYAVEQAGGAVFAAARSAIAASLAAAGPKAVDYTLAARDARLVQATTAARSEWASLMAAWDRAVEALVSTTASTTYPTMPEGVDIELLRGEAEMLLKAAPDALTGLLRLVDGPRRDLAAIALSPWASSWASVRGLQVSDLVRARRLAITAAASYGTAAEAAASRLYPDVFAVFGDRSALTGALRAAAAVFHDGGLVGPASAYEPGSVDLLAWRNGPTDVPPMTRVS